MPLERPDKRDVADNESDEYDDENDRDLHIQKLPTRTRRGNNPPAFSGIRGRQVSHHALDSADVHGIDAFLCLRGVFRSLRRVRISFERLLVVIRANPYELVRSIVSPRGVNLHAERRTGRHDVLREDIDKVVELSGLHRINAHFGRHSHLLVSRLMIDGPTTSSEGSLRWRTLNPVNPGTTSPVVTSRARRRSATPFQPPSSERPLARLPKRSSR